MIELETLTNNLTMAVEILRDDQSSIDLLTNDPVF